MADGWRQADALLDPSVALKMERSAVRDRGADLVFLSECQQRVVASGAANGFGKVSGDV
jgi:hypothetical protein